MTRNTGLPLDSIFFVDCARLIDEGAMEEEAGAVATSAEAKKIAKYAELARTHHVIPLAIETSGVFGVEAHEVYTELGRQMIQITGDPLTRCHITQQILVVCKGVML